MMNVFLLCHGTLKEAYLRDACAEYRKRLSAFCALTVCEVKDNASLLEKLPGRGTKSPCAWKESSFPPKHLRKSSTDLPWTGSPI